MTRSGTGGLVFILLMISACAQPPNNPRLSLTIRPRVIAEGQTAQVTVFAIDSSEKRAFGSLFIESSAGNLRPGRTVNLSDGTTTLDFLCNAPCEGFVDISAVWQSGDQLLTTVASIEIVKAGSALDAGMSDAGTADASVHDAGVDAGSSDSGLDAGQLQDAGTSDAGSSDAGGLTLRITTNGGAFAALAGQRTIIGVAGPPNQTVTLNTDAGLLRDINSSAPAAPSASSDTSPFGYTSFEFITYGIPGPASFEATMGSLHASATLTQQPIGGIGFVTCRGVNCELGLLGQGYNDPLLADFKVLSTTATPLPDVAISFAFEPIPGAALPPGIRLEQLMAITDVNGIAPATIHPGSSTGFFSIRATIVGTSTMVTTHPGTFKITSVLPSNRYLSVTCDKQNVALFTSTNCHLVTRNRYGQISEARTSVSISQENGQLAQSFEVVAGEANVAVSVQQLPKAVAPLAADPAQYPFARQAEPFTLDGGHSSHPRNGYYIYLASMLGEEGFVDANHNDVYDPGEQFIDQGEAFVDSNDNGRYDQGEFYIDDAPQNQHYDAPNHQWDSLTTIWTTFRLLATGPIDPSASMIVGLNGPFGTVSTNGIERLDIFACDSNMNRPVEGTTLTTRATAQRGTAILRFASGNLDHRGFTVEENLLLDEAGTGACDAGTPICGYFTRFRSWDEGCLLGQIQVTGVPQTIPGATTPISIDVDVTTPNTSTGPVTTTLSTTGFIDSH